ncbi:porin [Prosthecomicrobium pneumaticum]|uniref:Porin n=1 Tax=Prosthecomicrobium pneumaticum TaxID=81895 RepID=A0A7W9CTA6_9HYPH|nr:porin [Prosthecomicrobium pneumaticum]MBB5751505.1 hypothetical protein [Prosthecomicrobium pneumaticum]
MSLKSLLLGSAAVMMVAGAAQAADLTVAEPVDYVKVCDAFGKGYWYAPGTDTCIKIGGWVRAQVGFEKNLDKLVDNTSPAEDEFNDYQFRTRTSLTVTASSMTEYGPLTSFIDYRMESYGSQDGVSKLDSAWLQLGPVQAGKYTSSFDFGGGYTDDGGYRSDETTDHIAFTYALNGFGIVLSVEDPQDRTEEFGTGGSLSGDEEEFPDLVAALTYSAGIVSAKLSGAYVDASNSNDDSWAVQGGVELALDSFSKGDKFKLLAGYAQNAPSFVGATNISGTTATGANSKVGGNEDGEAWNILASYKHVWNGQWNSSITGSYVSFNGDTTADIDAWKVAFDTAFTPVANFTILGEVGYYENDGRGDVDSFFGFARLQRSFP